MLSDVVELRNVVLGVELVLSGVENGVDCC